MGSNPPVTVVGVIKDSEQISYEEPAKGELYRATPFAAVAARWLRESHSDGPYPVDTNPSGSRSRRFYLFDLPVHLVLGSLLRLIHGSAQASLLLALPTCRKVNDVRDALGNYGVLRKEPVLRESALRSSTSSVPPAVRNVSDL
jgi:hypothetical protein